MKLKKIGLLLVVIIILIIVGNIIYTSLILNNYSYNIITEARFFNNVFKENVKNELSFKHALGNENEQIYFYSYKNTYDLVIYKIDGFANVNLEELHLLINDDLNEIVINPQRLSELESYKIVSKSENIVAEKINVFTNNSAEIKKHFESIDYSYLNIVSEGILIGSLTEYLIKVKSKEKLNFNFAFVKDDNNFLLIILTSNTDKEFNEDILLNLIKKDIPN